MDTTVVKALSILEVLAGSPTPLGITELATTLNFSKSNVHRLLQTLASRGYVVASDHRYAATTRVWEVGAQVIGRLDVVQVAAKPMQRLVGQTDETAHLSILDLAACEVVSIHNVESRQPVRAYSRIGQRTPAHCVATGKALLSVQPLEALLKLPEELPRFTPHTVCRRDDLLEALEKTRGDGYSTNVGEWREQVGGAAAVVYDHTASPLAALGLTVPVARMKPDVMARYIPLIIETAAEISRLMGAPSRV
jgi:IclR family transcriptional regulator, KDG regulon repressor